jgi:hypothetical protein
MKRCIACFPLLCAVLLTVACSTGPRPVLSNPEVSVGAMRDAFEQDDVGLFLHTLGRPVLREYSEHVIRIGWSDIRPRVGEFVDGARVVEIVDVPSGEHADFASLPTPRGYVWPEPTAHLRRVRLAVGDDYEDFLFALEIDPPPPTAKQARGFWIGDRYFVRTEHSSPQTYLVDDSPEAERSHWRLVFPYLPYQQDGKLTIRLQEQLADS